MSYGFKAAAAAAFAACDVALFVIGQRTTGALGPSAGLVVGLFVDACLIVVSAIPRTVAVSVLATAVLVSLGESVAPGLLAPMRPLTPITLATGIPALLWNLATALSRREALAFAAVFALMAVRPWTLDWVWLYTGLSATVPLLLSLYVKTRRELLRSLRERAEIAERERHLSAEQAKLGERQRLAAEMHDIVTHHVTEIVLHAGALRVSTADDGVRAAAEQIRQAGERTLTELRDLIGILRRGDDRPVEAPPGRDVPLSDGVGELVSNAGATLRVTGESGTASPAIARAVYRVVQESLTNARKHAPGAEIAVEMSRRHGSVRVTVENARPDGPPDPSLAASGSAVGLEGLRRRVGLLGGTFTAGATARGGFRVSAELPEAVPTRGERDTA
ncbi:sensor histidine kinase [Streptomyces anulatus]|uniref:sensor histidine kinase n=1 Tax=Streptomyces anulatus TaxID=1892 RepID=UPI003417683D